MVRTGSGYYNLGATAEIAIYAKKAGVWNRITSRTVSVYGQYSTNTPQTINWTLDETFQLGTNIQMFGVLVESVSGYSVTSAQITDFASVSWQALGVTGGDASATPAGQLTSVTVRPQ